MIIYERNSIIIKHFETIIKKLLINPYQVFLHQVKYWKQAKVFLPKMQKQKIGLFECLYAYPSTSTPNLIGRCMRINSGQ